MLKILFLSWLFFVLRWNCTMISYTFSNRLDNFKNLIVSVWNFKILFLKWLFLVYRSNRTAEHDYYVWIQIEILLLLCRVCFHTVDYSTYLYHIFSYSTVRMVIYLPYRYGTLYITIVPYQAQYQYQYCTSANTVVR